MTKISEIGEFGLIDRIKNIIEQPSHDLKLLKGIGDDAAVIEKENGFSEVITTDLLVEQIHFDLLISPLEHLGFKAISANVSDIFAMNATPMYAVVSIGISENMTVENIESFYKGVRKACKAYNNMAVVGGDTSASVSGFVISVTVVGRQKTSQITYRKGARVGDVICVTGEIGSAYAGLKVLMKERRQMLEYMKEAKDSKIEVYKPFLEEHKEVIQKHLLPEARKDIIRRLEEREVLPTSMIDISDGLVSEIKHICKSSEVGAFIEEVSFPIANSVKEIGDIFSEEVINYAMFGGEDYELLFTVHKSAYSKLEDIEDITAIGEIKPNDLGIKMKTLYNEEVDILKAEKKGFEHF